MVTSKIYSKLILTPLHDQMLLWNPALKKPDSFQAPLNYNPAKERMHWHTELRHKLHNTGEQAQTRKQET